MKSFLLKVLHEGSIFSINKELQPLQNKNYDFVYYASVYYYDF